GVWYGAGWSDPPAPRCGGQPRIGQQDGAPARHRAPPPAAIGGSQDRAAGPDGPANADVLEIDTEEGHLCPAFLEGRDGAELRRAERLFRDEGEQGPRRHPDCPSRRRPGPHGQPLLSPDPVPDRCNTPDQGALWVGW